MKQLSIIFTLLLFFTACGDHQSSTSNVENDLEIINNDSDHSQENQDSYANFTKIPETTYSMKGLSLTSSPARMWHTFQPAEEEWSKKPLFIFFNGGPGSSTALLFTSNTSRMTADTAVNGGKSVGKNPYSFTDFGNILHVDARQTGFSYGTGTPSCDWKSLNVYSDAADFIRVILGVFKKHPEISKNPVYIVGESYGGIRATAMLNMILHYGEYREGKRAYEDSTLFKDLHSHFASYFEKDPEEKAFSPKDVSRQFKGQILIQPLVAGMPQTVSSGKILNSPESPLFDFAKEVEKEFIPDPNPASYKGWNHAITFIEQSGRDPYAAHKPEGFLMSSSEDAIDTLLYVETLDQMIESDPKEIELLYAENRENGYRCDGVGPIAGNKHMLPLPVQRMLRHHSVLRDMEKIDGNLASVFGELSKDDRYFIFLSSNITQAFYSAPVTPFDDSFGTLFLENIKDIRTFITNAEKDFIIYSPAIPATIAEMKDEVDSVTLKEESFSIDLKSGESVEIAFPVYRESGHSVTMFEPEKFYNDVKSWIEKAE